MIFIDDTSKLIDFCNILKKQSFIALDSEFIREKTYYPQLCLLQVAFDGGEALIDPLADIDLSPFFQILQNPDITKVFHAGRQDIEIFYNLTGKVPLNIFDTQIAAMVCGFSENIGYGNLVQAITGVELDKSRRLTDWSIRPLDEQQMNYAICDVTYLVTCYKFLVNKMKETSRLHWIDQEIDVLCNENCYFVNPDEAWHRIKHNVHTSRFLSALKHLAAWRENRAQKFNTPRSTILKDDVLLNIVSSMPKSVDDLKFVRNLKPEIAKGKIGAEIIEVLQFAKNHPISNEECKNDKKSEVHVPNHEQNLFEMLKLLLKIRCQDAGVVARLVANDADLRCIILNEPQNTLSMQGWRYDIFGQYAEKLCHGEISIAYNPQKKSIDLN